MTETISIPERRSELFEAMATGSGFALGFGWLWFSGLQGFFLPQFLWGSFWSGGGTSVFLAVLLVGFFGAWAMMRLRRKRNPDHLLPEEGVRKTRYSLVTVVHGLGLLLLVIGFLTQSHDGGFTAFIPALCSALAALCPGLFWTGALFGFSSFQILASFCSASLVALLLNLICVLIPPSLLPLALFLSMAGAWVLALILEHREIQKNQSVLSDEKKTEKRPRGRPPKKNTEKEESPEGHVREIFWKNFALFPILVFIVLGLGDSVLQEKDAWERLSPFASSLESTLIFCGTLVGAWMLCRKKPANPLALIRIPVLSFLFILLFQSFILLFVPGACAFSAPFLEGMLCVSVFYFLAESVPDQAYEKAALVLGLVLLLGNLTAGLGVFLAEFLPEDQWLRPITITGFFGMATAGILIFVYRRKKDVFALPLPVCRPTLFTDLTLREQELAALIAENRTNSEIGRRLNISDATVRFHLRNIYQKTGFTKRGELSAWIRKSHGVSDEKSGK